MKTCNVCKEEKDESCFSKDKGRKDGLCGMCQPCNQKRCKKWADENKEHRKYFNIKKLYGLEKKEYDAMYTNQKGLCKICGNSRKLHVDHCHKENKVRGLLCITCNIGIGHFAEKTERLQKAIEYLGG